MGAGSEAAVGLIPFQGHSAESGHTVVQWSTTPSVQYFRVFKSLRVYHCVSLWFTALHLRSCGTLLCFVV